MALRKVEYSEVRKKMRPGDVIAFGGKSQFSQLIKFATLSSVSHVATVLHTRIPEDDSDRYFNQVIESTGSGGGVTISRLSEVLQRYHGDIWWLPLKEEIRKTRFDQKIFFNFLFQQAKEKKPYDVIQGIGSVIDFLDQMPRGFLDFGSNKEDFSRFFCSELVAAGLREAGVVGKINPSEVTPIELCTWNIYHDEYYLLTKGPGNIIKNFNSRRPEIPEKKI